METADLLGVFSFIIRRTSSVGDISPDIPNQKMDENTIKYKGKIFSFLGKGIIITAEERGSGGFPLCGIPEDTLLQ